MTQPDDSSTPFDPDKYPVQFATTCWTTIIQAQGEPNDGDGLAKIYTRYQPLLVKYLKTRRSLPGDAEDLVQGFFLDFIERKGLEKVDPRRGSFRSFILKSLKNYVFKQWDRIYAQKREGGKQLVEWEDDWVGTEATAGRDFDRGVAAELVARATQILRDEYRDRDLAAPFEQLLGLMNAVGETATEAAKGLGLSANTLHKAVSDLRRRHRVILRRCAAELLGPDDDVDGELRYLISILE